MRARRRRCCLPCSPTWPPGAHSSRRTLPSRSLRSCCPCLQAPGSGSGAYVCVHSACAVSCSLARPLACLPLAGLPACLLAPVLAMGRPLICVPLGPKNGDCHKRSPGLLAPARSSGLQNGDCPYTCWPTCALLLCTCMRALVQSTVCSTPFFGVAYKTCIRECVDMCVNVCAWKVCVQS